jgi:FAS-associated factor 2
LNVASLFQEIQRQKIEYQKRIPDEPPSDHPEAVQIVIKLPNGMRLERRFLQSHSLEVTASCTAYYI